jgi:serine/threonine protein kinase
MNKKYCINYDCSGHREHYDKPNCPDCEADSFCISNDRYQLIKRVNKTLHSEVFIAIDTYSSSKVIVKTLITDRNIDKTLFRREADILERIHNHHGIPNRLTGVESLRLKYNKKNESGNIYEETLDLLYCVMEYIEGEDLKQWLDLHNKIPNQETAWKWLYEVTYILCHVHKLGFIHRDIKPSNIIITDERPTKLVLIDYGAANHTSSSPDENTKVGTEGYADSEQLDRGKSDYKSDFHALGQTFYQLTTGNPLTKKQPGEDWGKDTNFPNSPIIDLIDWMTKIHREERPQSTGEILHAIDLFKNSYTRQEAKSFIQNRSKTPEAEKFEFISQLETLTLESGQLQSELQEQDRLIIEHKINTNRSSNMRSILVDQHNTLGSGFNKLVDLYNTLVRKFNWFRKIIIGASITAIVAVIVAGSMSKLYFDSQSLLGTQKEANQSLIGNNKSLTEENDRLKNKDNVITAERNKTKVDLLTSSGEENLNVFKSCTVALTKLKKDENNKDVKFTDIQFNYNNFCDKKQAAIDSFKSAKSANSF